MQFHRDFLVLVAETIESLVQVNNFFSIDQLAMDIHSTRTNSTGGTETNIYPYFLIRRMQRSIKVETEKGHPVPADQQLIKTKSEEKSSLKDDELLFSSVSSSSSDELSKKMVQRELWTFSVFH